MKDDSQTLNSIRNILLALLVILFLYIMQALAGVMLPLVIAVIIVLLYEPLFRYMNKTKIPVKLITPILAVGTLGILFVVIQIFADSAQAIYADRVELGQQLYDKILAILNYVDSISPIELDASDLETWIAQLTSQETLTSLGTSTIGALGTFGSKFFMFALYFLILLFSMSGYDKYIKYIAGDDKRFLLNAKHIQHSIAQYMTVKFITSSTTGAIAMIICLSFNIKYAIFWGFATFALNFIPTIGSIIATTLPAMMAFIQFDSPLRIILSISFLTATQMTIGQFLEPKIMGNRLQLNTITVIFGLVFWSYIWGIPGAFLSIPLMVIVKIFLQNNDSFIFLSRIMGRPE